MLWIWVSAVYQETRKRDFTFRAPKMVNFRRSSRTTIFSVDGCTIFWSSTEFCHFAKFFQLVSMGVKNFETGVLVQKFHQGSAKCVQFFFQKGKLTRRPVALEYFTPTKFAKNVFLQPKGNAVWSQSQIPAKNPNVKKTFFETLLFREIVLHFCCHVSRRKKSMSFRRISTFLVQKTFFWKVRFWVIFVTKLTFLSKTQNYNT